MSSNAHEQLTAYLDGELDSTSQAEVEARLAADPALRGELDELRNAIAFVKAHAPVRAPEGFADRVLARVADEPMPNARWSWLRRPFGMPLEGLAVAAVALIVLILAVQLPGADQAPGEGETDTRAGAVDASWYDQRDADPPASPKAEVKKQQQAAPPTPEAPTKETSSQKMGLGKGLGMKAPPAPSAADVAGEATPTPTAATHSKTTPGTAEESGLPTGATAGYRFVVSTEDPDVMVQLQRVAAKYRGVVTTADGESVGAPTLDEDASVVVRLPNDRLAEFGDALRSLGLVKEYLEDPVIYGGDEVPVRVDLQLTTAPAQLQMDKVAEELPALE